MVVVITRFQTMPLRNLSRLGLGKSFIRRKSSVHLSLSRSQWQILLRHHQSIWGRSFLYDLHICLSHDMTYMWNLEVFHSLIAFPIVFLILPELDHTQPTERFKLTISMDQSDMMLYNIHLAPNNNSAYLTASVNFTDYDGQWRAVNWYIYKIFMP